MKVRDSKMQGRVDDFLKLCRDKGVEVSSHKVIKAFNYVTDAHNGALRLSGHTISEHCLATAELLVQNIHVDETSVLAAVLHNIYRAGNQYNYQAIESEFGTPVASIIDHIDKIQKIENENIELAERIENYRRLLLSLFSDIRILFVKIADILEDLSTIDYLPDERRLRYAKDVLYVYTPFVNRMGLHNIKWQMEDLSFRIVNPEAYNEIEGKLQATKEERDQYVKDIIKPINERIQNDSLVQQLGLNWKIYGRAKHIYSIYNKMLNRNRTFEELYDIFALRIVLNTENPRLCHYVYGLVADLYPPAAETFKDYVSAPKRNGYQSIHTGVIAKDNKMIEIQFRTEDMHLASEKGVAAHFRYKNNKVSSDSVFEDQNVTDWLADIRDVFESIDNRSFEEVLDHVNRNLFMDEIYLLTPQNDYVSLPRGSVPLDYAYKIHTQIGTRYVGAKVNSKVVPINYKLRPGDRCEIITSKNAVVREEWLQYVVTPKAKNNIKRLLKEALREKMDKGWKTWWELTDKHNLQITDDQVDVIAKAFNFGTSENLMCAIADSEFDITKAIDFAYYRMSNYASPTDSEKSIDKAVESIPDYRPDSITVKFKVGAARKQPALNEILLTLINSGTVNLRELTISVEGSVLTFNFTVHSYSRENLIKIFIDIRSHEDVSSLEVPEEYRE